MDDEQIAQAAERTAKSIMEADAVARANGPVSPLATASAYILSMSWERFATEIRAQGWHAHQERD